MIPTMILFGLILGRWWWLALPLAAAGWPILLLVTDTIGAGQIPLAALLGLLNAAVGVVVLQAVLWVLRVRRHSTA
jgi:hypothetical protein